MVVVTGVGVGVVWQGGIVWTTLRLRKCCALASLHTQPVSVVQAVAVAVAVAAVAMTACH